MDAISLFDSGMALFAQTSAAPTVTAAANTAQTATTAPGVIPGWVMWLVALALIAGSYFLASFLAKSWRMYDYTGRFFIVIFSTVLGVAIVALGWPPKLGIDLSGGQILIYNLDQARLLKTELDETDLLKVSSVINNVLKSEKGKTPEVKLVDGAKDKLQIDITGIPLNQVDEITQALSAPDVLPSGASLQKVANSQTNRLVQFQLQQGLTKDVMGGLVSALTNRINPGGQKEIKIKPFGDTGVEIMIPKAEPAEIAMIKQKLSTAGTLEFRILANDKFPAHKRLIELAKKQDADLVIDPETKLQLGKWIAVREEKGAGIPLTCPTRQGRAGTTQALVAYDDPEDFPVVTGLDLSRASAEQNTDLSRGGPWLVSFVLKGAGERNFGKLTKHYVKLAENKGTQSQLAIVMDNQIYTAPNLQSAITGGQGVITGSFTEPEVRLTATVLNSGSLPAALNKTPIAEDLISSQLGDDTIKSGGTAMVIATCAILAFMLWFYGFSGFVADLAVILNILLVVALMITLKAAFTLAGLAGLVLSVGMAVDANVLIFERMREEVQRGSALKMAIRNGFAKAMSTVVDSNLTTLISGIVLFAIGTEQLKGFATTLILGLLLNLFTAVYCSRIMFDVAEKRGWITRLKMRSLLGETKFDFVRPVTACVTISCVLIAAGLGLAVWRGENFFDIDFTGGSTVSVVLKKDQPDLSIADARKIVSEGSTLPDIEISKVFGEINAPQKFKIVTSELKLDVAKSELSKAFGDKLERYTMTVANVGPYVPPKPPAPSKTETDKKEPEKSDAEKKDADKKETEKKDTEVKDPATKDPATEPAPMKEGAAKEPMTEAPAATEKEAAKDAATDAAKDAKDAPTKDAPAKDTPTTDAPTKDTPAKDDEGKQQSRLFQTTDRWLALAAANPISSLPLWHSGLLLQADEKKEPEKKEPETKATEPAKAAETPKATEPAQATETPKATEAPKPTETPKATEPFKGIEPQAPISPLPPITPLPPISPLPAIDPLKGNDPAKGTTIDPAMLERILAQANRQPASEANYKSQAELTFSTEVSKQYLNDLALALLKPPVDKDGKTILDKEGKPLEPKFTMKDYDFRNAQNTADDSALFKTWTMVSSADEPELRKFVDALSQQISSQPVFSQVSNVGSEIAGGTQKNALWALIVSLLAIILYVWFRFQNVVFGFAAVIALIHDVLITIGFLALSSYIAPTLSSIGLGFLGINPFKISLEVVAALLTIIGFSINDTIVIFDRIRELRGKSPDITKDMVNKAVNQTLGRTILTSGTVFVVTCILYFFGGEEIHPFSFAMLIGLISGTYSTVYIAAPIVLWFKKRQPRTTTMSSYTGVSQTVSK